nr:uncharacterized protein LOC109179324 [Ipomoea batatas]
MMGRRRAVGSQMERADEEDSEMQWEATHFPLTDLLFSFDLVFLALPKHHKPGIALQKAEFRNATQIIQQRWPDAYNYLANIEPEAWTLSHDGVTGLA